MPRKITYRCFLTQSKQLKKGSQARKDWIDPPYATDLKIYLFNVTNANDVHNGAKPEVAEIGPYFYT